MPALTAALGGAAGVVLGRTALARRHKVLGVEVPRPKVAKIDMGGLASQVGEAGRQFARLAQEVRTVREKAEQIARILG